MKTFFEFLKEVTEEQRAALQEWGSVISKAGYEIVDHTDEREDPYVFVKLPEDSLYRGLRIYYIVDDLTYRRQDTEDEPAVGVAHKFDVEQKLIDLEEEGVPKKEYETLVQEFVVGELNRTVARLQEAKRIRDEERKRAKKTKGEDLTDQDVLARPSMQGSKEG